MVETIISIESEDPLTWKMMTQSGETIFRRPIQDNLEIELPKVGFDVYFVFLKLSFYTILNKNEIRNVFSNFEKINNQ